MSIGDILSAVGRGAEDVGRVAGAVLEPLGKRTAEVVSSEAPQLDEERRQQAMQLSNQQRELKANELEQQLEMGRKYGTLTPDQQKQYVDAITGLYSKPEDQVGLLQRIHRAIHPQGAVRQPAQALPSAVPVGGTQVADEANAEKLAGMRRPSREYQSPDGRERNWFVPGQEPEGWQAVVGTPRKSTAKSPPTPGNQIPQDAVGPDGNPIAPELRNASHSFTQWNGAWYPSPKAKPVIKMVGNDLLLIDSQTGQVLRKIAKTSAKVTSHQTPFLGDDGQMHLLTTYSVQTPQGETIEAEGAAPDIEEPGQSKPSTPVSGGTQKTPAKKITPGHVMRSTGAKPNVAGPVIPGSRTWAASKSPLFKSDIAQYTKVSEDANTKAEAYKSAAAALASGSTASSDQELIYQWVRSNVQGAGRMTQAEFRQAAATGSLPLRAQTAWQKTTTGKLPPELEQMFLADIKRSADISAQEAADLRKRVEQPGTGAQPQRPSGVPAGFHFDQSALGGKGAWLP